MSILNVLPIEQTSCLYSLYSFSSQDVESNVHDDEGSAVFHLLWDGSGLVEVRLGNSTNFDNVCGLCGNFDSDPWNDFQLPDGNEV